MALLAAVALHVRDREAEDFDLGEALLDGFQTVRLNDGDDPFHGKTPATWGRGVAAAKPDDRDLGPGDAPRPHLSGGWGRFYQRMWELSRRECGAFIEARDNQKATRAGRTERPPHSASGRLRWPVAV